eukprot:Opistho-1_new@46163
MNDPARYCCRTAGFRHLGCCCFAKPVNLQYLKRVSSINPILSPVIPTKMKYLFSCILVCMLLISLVTAQELQSPDQQLTLRFSLQTDGTPSYSLLYKNKTVIKPSKLGIELESDSVPCTLR